MPLIGETIGQLLRRITAEGPERAALVTRHQTVRWTYADLLRRSEDLARKPVVGLRDAEQRVRLTARRQDRMAKEPALNQPLHSPD
jgi:acyl-CoA synthetase (AMP-forming)/AMP-acid ligase II